MSDSKYTKSIMIIIFLTMVLTMPAQADTGYSLPSDGNVTAFLESQDVSIPGSRTITTHMPENFNFDDNFYTTYGGPNLTANIVGNNEFSKGETTSLTINLANKGVITGFESEEDALTKLEKALQKTEMDYETQKTTAIGIVSTLESPHQSIKVKSSPQESGSLPPGEETDIPPEFTIEIEENAKPGTYPLILNTLYGYQKNVQVSGDNVSNGDITNLEVGIWYDSKSQNHTIPIRIEDEAEFDVTNVSADLRAGEEGVLTVTYENIGNQPVKDATVGITASDPFSTTDDQAFLGSLAPGESAEGVFNLNVDQTATSKMYAINSEIKYEDMDGDEQISDTQKVQVRTLPAITLGDQLNNHIGLVYILVLLALIGLAIIGYMKLVRGRKRKSGE
ncbi:MAG: COG1361 S-layer family protein [Methanohalobium sp.]|uniref:COG1361 S-layer family protein n=1 Tax=Methanohalobium sp. TaxID=2837493 RepID=UPI0039788D6E